MTEHDLASAKRLWRATWQLRWQQTEAESIAYSHIMQQLYALPGADEAKELWIRG